jgi:predicted ABC-type ATPase
MKSGTYASRVEAAVSRQLAPDCRDDVKSDLVMALLSGEVRPGNAKAAAGQLITRWHRMFSRRDISFDQELIGGKGPTLGGMIAEVNSYVPVGVQVIRAG